jgi:exopolysaccharide biosynthesis polyprenyl glycosylphosphotransferase
MSNRIRRIALQRLARFFDLAIVVFLFLVVLALNTGAATWPNVAHVFTMRVTVGNVVIFAVYIALCSAIFSGCSLYRSHRLSRLSRRVREVLLAVTLITVIFLVLRGPLELSFATNNFLIIFWLLTFTSLMLSHEAGLRLLHFARARGRNLRHIVIVGERQEASALAERFEKDSNFGYHVLDIIAPEGSREMAESEVGAKLDSVLHNQSVDEVLVSLPPKKYSPLVEQIVSRCEEEGVIVRVRAGMFELRTAKAYADELEGLPILTIRSGPEDDWRLAAKSLIDALGSLILLLMLAPLFALTALVIKLDSRGPIFFTQERVGLNKRRFRMLKFRTMVNGAEKQQAALEELNEAEGPVFKIKDDPRVTPVGKFLRRFSVDELPQLFNVLKGDMSLVGPRPLPVRDVERIDVASQKRRFSIKPGLTCLWQVNGRSSIGFEEWVRMDLDYIDRWSLGLDILILLKTIPAVFKGPGAY